MSSPPQDPNALPPLSASILGVEPLDEFIKEIADFVHGMIVRAPEFGEGNVEVEAKIGVIRDRQNSQRLQLPVLVETMLRPDSLDIRFESNMSTKQHKHYNELLNKLKTSSTQRSHPTTPMTYAHLYLIDSFYPSADQNASGKDRVRVTREEKTGNVIECVKKIRLGDLNIYSPKHAADWRISVNLEVPMPHPVGSATHQRRKDRLSYAHQEFSIDLTQVTANNGPGQPSTVLHELELEIARSQLLVNLASTRGAPGEAGWAFDELIRAFVNNARILVRNAAGESWG